MEIIINDIKKKYGKHIVLKGISFSVEVGSCIGITGRNGCGKTTLISILAGTDSADSGQIVLPSAQFKIGYLPQVNPLLERVSVIDNLKLWADSKARIEQVLDRYHLREIKNKAIYKLSGGMKRRVAIACALINEPDLLIMDEPTSALDIEYKKIIHDEMKRFVNNGGTIIMVTHELEEINMCDKCYMIDDGIINS